MSLRIQHNITALTAHRAMQINDVNLSKSLERLSTGYRINRASDDAAGLAISMRFRSQLKSLNQGTRNASEATALLQVAEGAADQITNILERMKELATQAASTNTGSADRANISSEVEDLEEEIDRIAESTKYSGTNLITGAFGATGLSGGDLGNLRASQGIQGVDVSNAAVGTTFSITMATTSSQNVITIDQGTNTQTITASNLNNLETDTLNFSTFGIKITVGKAFNDLINFTSTTDSIETSASTSSSFQLGYEDTDDNRISFTLSDMRKTGLGADISVSTLSEAQASLTTIDLALDTLANARAQIGRTQNRFAFASANLASTIENLTAAESVIRDADIARETVDFTKNQILIQAGTSMLSQANLAPQALVRLLG